jgi:hypothetical protein
MVTTSKSITTYSVNGYKMNENPKTWNMERGQFLTNFSATSMLYDIDTQEDREFFEGEISKQLNCDWFELISFSIK